MSEILNKNIVLVLNRNWQAINTRTPADAFCQMATNVATALDIDGDSIRPVAWSEWLTLPIRSHDNVVNTVRGAIRVPTVIIALNFAKVPKKRPKLNACCVRTKAASTTWSLARAADRTPGKTWFGPAKR